MAHPQLEEAERPQRRLGPLDLAPAPRGSPACRTAPARPGRRPPACPTCAGRAGGEVERTSALVKPASTSGKARPAAAAARCPGRWSPRSSRFTPEHHGGVALGSASGADARPSARPCSGSTGRRRCAGRRRGRARRCGPRPSAGPTRGPARRSRRARTPASEGDTAVTAAARSGPSVSWATQARRAESAPPLKATITRSRSSRCSRSAARSPIGSALRPAVRPDAGQHLVDRRDHARVERPELGVLRPRPGRSAWCRRPP